MRTQIVRFGNTYEGDIIKFNKGYREVEMDGNGKFVRGYNPKDSCFVERVITQNPLVRLKRYLIG